MVAINLEGLCVSLVRTIARKPACFFSISIWILLAERNAISIPEKKAERIRLIMIIRISLFTVISGYLVVAFQNASGSFGER
jgi:hypothetical protein